MNCLTEKEEALSSHGNLFREKDIPFNVLIKDLSKIFNKNKQKAFDVIARYGFFKKLFPFGCAEKLLDQYLTLDYPLMDFHLAYLLLRNEIQEIIKSSIPMDHALSMVLASKHLNPNDDLYVYFYDNILMLLENENSSLDSSFHMHETL